MTIDPRYLAAAARLNASLPKKDSYIDDPKLYFRWQAIKKYMKQSKGYTLHDQMGQLLIRDCKCYIAKHSTKMRLYSHIDWCHYTPKGLAQAIESDSVDQYYEQMLKDHRSDPNVWQRPDEEHEMKTYYAARAGRASIL